jgi:epoxyqueuosine reductase
MTTEKMKKTIKEFSLGLGADAVGFASIKDYKSVKAPALKDLLPSAQSMVVLGYREPDGALNSPIARISMAARMAVMDLSKRNNLIIAKFIEDRFGAEAAFVLVSYPMDNQSTLTKGLVGDISLRHAAVAAGLGVFGRHNLVIHPVFGTRILFTAIVTSLPLSSDPSVQEELCSQCNLCVEKCPAGALDKEGITDEMKCLAVSQPYGIGGAIRYIGKFFGAAPDENKKLLRDPLFQSLYQASYIGQQYECFNCEAVCPVGRKKRKQKQAL